MEYSGYNLVANYPHKEGVCMRILDFINDINFSPRVGIVLGSGLGGLVDRMDIVGRLPYAEVDGMPRATVDGHVGQFVFGYIGGVAVLAMQGRIHYYEGYDIKQVVFPIIKLKEAGISRLIITNAAGGVNTSLSQGMLMLISDHILNIPNPLIGRNNDALGKRFPDMSNIYKRELRARIREIAANNDIPLEEGVYLQLSGPSYETPAEIKMFRHLGADAVGMSTACEAVMANYLGIEVIGISCITNMAAGLHESLNHKEVIEAGRLAQDEFARLVELIITKL